MLPGRAHPLHVTPYTIRMEVTLDLYLGTSVVSQVQVSETRCQTFLTEISQPSITQHVQSGIHNLCLHHLLLCLYFWTGGVALPYALLPKLGTWGSSLFLISNIQIVTEEDNIITFSFPKYLLPFLLLPSR